jgi:hypothetical protein
MMGMLVVLLVRANGGEEASQGRGETCELQADGYGG